VERGAWTEERLDDLASSMREGFARQDQSIRDVRGEIAQLRIEMDALRQTMFRGFVTMWVGFLGVLVAILTNGA
jgi:hypothetical protein